MSVQVALFDLVIVGYGNLALGASTKTHHSPVLEHLAADGTCTNEKLLDVAELLLVFLTQNGDLAIVARANRGALLFRTGCGGGN